MLNDSQQSNYTLDHYFNEAQLGFSPDWAKEVVLPNPPFKHQIGDLNHLAMFSRSGIWNEPGIGKTRPIQAYGLWLAAQGNKIVYIMPPVLVPQFQNSLASTYADYSNFVSCAGLQATLKKREKLIEQWNSTGWPDVVVMSYRMFVQYHTLLKQNGFTCAIVDEATAVKSPSSQIHKAVKIFAGKPGDESNGVVLVTGSPIDTNVIDAYGLIAILDPNRYGSRRAFERTHCDIVQTEDMPRPVITGYKNFDYLNQSLMSAGRRIKKADALDLPPRVISELPVQLSPDHKRLYKKLVDERIAEIGEEVIDMTSQSALYQGMQRALLCPETYTDKPPKNEILTALDTLIQSLDNRKVVIYCWYRESIKKLAERYKEHNPAILYGGTSQTQREVQKQKFIADESCRIILANPKSGGVGVDGFQEVCSHAIYAEVCPFPGVFQQSIDRLHRSGQKAQSVTAYVVVPVGTIAVKLRNDLLKKDMQQELAVKDARTCLKDLMGESGLQGSLDNMEYL